MAEECIIVTFGVDERHSKCCCDAQLFCARPPASLRWVDRGRAKWIASIEPTEWSVFVFKHDSAYIHKEFPVATVFYQNDANPSALKGKTDRKSTRLNSSHLGISY